MTRYYFDIEVDGKTTSDEEGMELADIEAAQAEASRSICDMSKDLFRRRMTPQLAIEVRDEVGPIMRASIKFDFKRFH